MNALIVPIVLETVLRVPVSLEMSRANFLRLTAIYLVSAVPFFLTGLQFSIIFARECKHISRLYGADLAGGALACLGIVPLLNWPVCCAPPFAATIRYCSSSISACIARPSDVRRTPARTT